MTEKDIVRVESSFSIEAGYEAMQRLLKKSSSIDGVFCATDEIAIGALMYLKDIGKKVPEEIKICGIGEHQISRIISPKLTTAKYHYETSGIEAAKLLMDIIKDESKNPVLIKQLMLGYEIIHRETI
jgi:LacI family sucrose operon transcriptional repressor